MGFRWLEETERLQRETYGYDFPLTPPALAHYFQWNVTALVAELGEMLVEFPGWKPWVTAPGQEINRDRVVQELVDVEHFIANLLVSVGCDDDEFWTRYRAKMAVNRGRQERGYDGVSEKDERGRATDEPRLVRMTGGNHRPMSAVRPGDTAEEARAVMGVGEAVADALR